MNNLIDVIEHREIKEHDLIESKMTNCSRFKKFNNRVVHYTNDGKPIPEETKKLIRFFGQSGHSLSIREIQMFTDEDCSEIYSIAMANIIFRITYLISGKNQRGWTIS